MSERMPMATMERSVDCPVRAAVPAEAAVWLMDAPPDEIPPWEEVRGNPVPDAGEEPGRAAAPDDTPPWEDLPERPVPDTGEELGHEAPPGMDEPADANQLPNRTAPSPPAESTEYDQGAPTSEPPITNHAAPTGESTASPDPNPPPDPGDTPTPPAAGPLLTGYSHQKRLPLQFLKGLGLGEDGRAVQIPYYDARGNMAALRLRHPPGADPRFSWQPGARPLPYGLWLALNRLAKALVLVEGESDAHTLWLLGFPALGIPGSCAFKAEWATLLQNRPLYIHQENDAGGAAFLRHTLHALRRGGHTGPVYVFAASQADARCKDLSDLWLHNMPLAPQVIGALIKGAQPCAPGAPGTEPGPAAPATARGGDNALSPSGGADVAAEVGNVDAAKAAAGAAGREDGAHAVADMPGAGKPTAAQHAGNAADGQAGVAYAMSGEMSRLAVAPVGQVAGAHAVADMPGTVNPADAQSVAEPAVPPLDPFEAYAASSLWGKQLQAPPMIWQGRLTAGLCLLAGAPKKGKSWMALALAIAVAQGSPFLGCATHRGEVLYLDLESRAHRVQERLHVLCQGPAPAGLYIAHQAQRMEEGLLPALTSWHAQHPKASLIIVDTLARVKCPGRAGENVYEADTRLLGNLQRFALDKGLRVLLVHHLRKSAGFRERDVYERVSGSMGITGACDCVLVLDGARQEAEARLQLDGRDIPPAQLALRFEGGRWTLLSHDAGRWEDERAYADSPLPGALQALMQGRERWEGTATELSQILEKGTRGQVMMPAAELITNINKLATNLEAKLGLVMNRRTVRGQKRFTLTRVAAVAAEDALLADPFGARELQDATA